MMAHYCCRLTQGAVVRLTESNEVQPAWQDKGSVQIFSVPEDGESHPCLVLIAQPLCLTSEIRDVPMLYALSEFSVDETTLRERLSAIAHSSGLGDVSYGELREGFNLPVWESDDWWAIVDSNHRPRSYQDRALTN
jgi:hypothetical protein